MQVLLAWKSQELSDIEAFEHWSTIIETWRKKYQPLVDDPLHIAVAHVGTLFLGLISIPNMFLEWQEFYEDESYAVAWSGISHNLLDKIPQQNVDQMNPGFLSQLQDAGDSFLRELDGRFIVSVLNHDVKTLQIITNNFGLTPCFWTQGKYGIAIGTRIAPLIELVGGKYVPDRAGLVQMVAMDWCLGSRTTFEGVFQVDPGMKLLLQEEYPTMNAQCYCPPQVTLEQAETLSHEDYLKIGSDTVHLMIKQQFRHSKAPLMDLTGGMDTRAIIASTVALGYHPECNVTGVAGSKEVEIASQVAEAMNLTLHRLYPGEHYAENLDNYLRSWILWTEGMIPAHINLVQSVGALSPKLRKFFSQYCQIFSGVGGGNRHPYYGTEVLAETPTSDKVIARLFKGRTRVRFRKKFISDKDDDLIIDDLKQVIVEAARLGLTGYELIDYFYWRERASRWGGFLTDAQQIGKHVFAPLCHKCLTAVFFAMTVKENLACVWHNYHIQRMMPSISTIPFLNPPVLSGLRKLVLDNVLDLHPACRTVYRVLANTKRTILNKRKRLPLDDIEKLGNYFHPYLQKLLFSGNEWWPNIIQYEQGQTIWKNYVKGKEVKPLWNLVTLELWAKNFL